MSIIWPGPAEIMTFDSTSTSGVLVWARIAAYLLIGLSAGSAAMAQQPGTAAPANSPQEVREAGPPRRIPRQQALTTAALDGTVREQVSEGVMRPVGGTRIQIRNVQTGQVSTTLTTGEGIFRLLLLAPGGYEFRAEAEGYEAMTIAALSLNANEVTTLEIRLVPTGVAEARSRLPRQPELGPPLPAEAAAMAGSYREFRHRLDSDPNYIVELSPDVLPPISDVFNVVPNRWALEQPDYRRYRPSGEYIYTKPHWYDPFNRNRFKGDEPIWPAVLGQQVFLNVSASETTFIDGRKVPSPSNVSAAQAGSSEFFGRGEQFFLDQTFRFTFDLFHGDASFKPVDWRFRVTPEVSLNYLDVKELGIVGPDVRAGTTRLDSHVGFQEAFVEYKLHDLSANYDFVSVRAGIQEFNADFRGFLFVDEQPALRIFGDLKSDRLEY
ncbi:MAG TPA: carboxypeptidase-like regulatory domain-containing protein, partial [Candidatus Acidoferrum sp.]|nr:carboxypeptidase-like regulatory domain-containing protein [Candidatus Acidoferrum sp.]